MEGSTLVRGAGGRGLCGESHGWRRSREPSSAWWVKRGGGGGRAAAPWRGRGLWTELRLGANFDRMIVDLHRHASRSSGKVFTVITEHKNPVSVEHSRLLRLRMRTEVLLMATQARTSSRRCCGGSSHLFCVFDLVGLWVGARWRQDVGRAGAGVATPRTPPAPAGGNNTDGHNTLTLARVSRRHVSSNRPGRSQEDKNHRRGSLTAAGTRASAEGQVGRQMLTANCHVFNLPCVIFFLLPAARSGVPAAMHQTSCRRRKASWLASTGALIFWKLASRPSGRRREEAQRD